MLISFAVENYLSIKDRVELSMQTIPDKASDDNILKNNYQTFSLSEKEDKKYNILKSALIYGLNASGKSNLLKSINVFSKFIVDNYERGSKEIPIVPFKLDSETRNKPSFFEALILLDGTYYRYGFTATEKHIHKEWLFSSTKGRESRIIFREKHEDTENYNFYNSKFRSLHKQVRGNSLLLTVASLNNVTEAQDIVSFFENISFRENNSRILPNDENRTLVQDILKNIDIGISSLHYKKANKEIIDDMKKDMPFPEGLDTKLVSIIHDTVVSVISEREFLFFEYKDSEGKNVLLNEDVQSTGTLIIFSLIADLINRYNSNSVILIDEVEESLHPLLLQYFFKLFHAIPNNKMQIICTTHNVLLMGEGFRRDQLYITEKDENLATTLVSIDDFTGISKKTPKQIVEMYLDGRFGGVPALSDLDIMKFVQSLEERES